MSEAVEAERPLDVRGKGNAHGEQAEAASWESKAAGWQRTGGGNKVGGDAVQMEVNHWNKTGTNGRNNNERKPQLQRVSLQVDRFDADICAFRCEKIWW